MQDLHGVQHFQPLHHLNEDVPNFIFFDVFFLYLVIGDFLEQVATVRKLHDDAE